MATVEITDVFMRDGLQDEAVFVPVERRVWIGRQLALSGVRRVEAGSFVNAQRVPQMAGAAEVVKGLLEYGPESFTVLALNGRGVDLAVEAGATEISLAVSASEAHSFENSGRGTEDVLAGLARTVASYPSISFSGAVATAFTCPFEGTVPNARLNAVVEAFAEMGVMKIALADTLGNTPTGVLISSLRAAQNTFAGFEFGLHLHNAHGQAIDTALRAIELGVVRFDAALAGYGGCPFAPGAAGNVATEDLVAACHGAGHTTGIDEELLAEAAANARLLVSQGTPLG